MGKTGIADCDETRFIGASREHPLDLSPRSLDATREHQRCITQVGESDRATFLDSPTMPKLSGQACLSSLRDPCCDNPSHACIVPSSPARYRRASGRSTIVG